VEANQRPFCDNHVTETMSEPHSQLQDGSRELREEITRLIEQSRRSQEGMARICDDLQRLQIKVATNSELNKEKP
jgi:hypothetical protein